ncbi:MAG: acyl-CoA dehydrogenase family protein [Vicinamibacterales bacterium]
MTAPTTQREQHGGTWVLNEGPIETYTPERMTDEHRLIARTAREFIDQEVLPRLAQLETKDWALSRRLVRTCAELGLIGTDVPEEYGGVDLDKVSSIVVAEEISRSASFGATFGAQTGLTLIPLVCFGTDDQKRRYVPGLADGDLVGAYALSESGSGSDALGARARASRQPDGSFVLTGEKMWITNGGFADLFVVFAKVDGEHFTAFLVERGFPGVSSGKEEHKMGLHGSSTAPLVLQEVRVPAANVLGEVGKGHKVAFNVLNYGRFKLGAMASGGAKEALAQSAKYATTRRQFGQPIGQFGAIKLKLAAMTARLFAVESALYRLAGAIDAKLAAGDTMLAALEEFAIEASITKVAGSEMLDFVLDENVQIHGGNGYVADYPAERMYRDARVNRIFEGTNEINRLLIPTMFVRRATKGAWPLREALTALGAPPTSNSADLMTRAEAQVRHFKHLSVLALSVAARRFGEKLGDEQEVLTWIADMLIETYLAESAVARARQSSAAALSTAPLAADAAVLMTDDTAAHVSSLARQALVASAEPAALERCLAATRAADGLPPLDTVAIRRRLAAAAMERGAYPFAG